MLAGLVLAQSPPPPSIPCASEYTGNPSEATVRGCNTRCRQGFYKNQRKQPNPCSWCACAACASCADHLSPQILASGPLSAPPPPLLATTGAKTNVLLLLSDDQGWNDVGYNDDAVLHPGSHPGANATAYLFFDLDSDPTESSPANAASPELVRKYTGILRHFVAGLRRSQVNESKCLGPDD